MEVDCLTLGRRERGGREERRREGKERGRRTGGREGRREGRSNKGRKEGGIYTRGSLLLSLFAQTNDKYNM